MDITCVADLHGHYPELEGGDLLIIAGDLTKRDEPYEYIKFLSWLHKQEYKRYIVIAGNHDNIIQNEKIFGDNLAKTDYLEDSGTEFEYQIANLPEENEGFLPSGKRTLKIWGSPWTKTFPRMNPHCKAFTFDTDEELEERWKLIPNDIDILITHSPPYGFLDEVDSQEHCTSYHVGSRGLLKRVCEIRPQLHVFGHIHEGYGEDIVRDWKRLKIEESGITQDIKDVAFINASHVNEYYEPVNKPIRVIL